MAVGAALPAARDALAKRTDRSTRFKDLFLRAGAASFVSVIVVLLWNHRKRLQEVISAIGAASSGKRRVSKVSDPIFGKSIGLVYKMDNGTELWEDMLQGLRFPEGSPIRRHIRQLFSRPELEEQLRNLFDALARGAPRLTQGDVRRFSNGIQGHMHVLLQKSTEVPLVSATPQDMDWIKEKFDSIFPDERPLDRQAFPSFAKFVLLRRVVRTLIESVGMDGIQAGVAVPLVIDVVVESGGETPPFRVHTVTPSSAPGIDGKECFLGLIKEEKDRFMVGVDDANGTRSRGVSGTIMEGEEGACSP